MNIGIIVYSQTGNTYTVAQKLKEKLEAGGHTANVEKVTFSGEATPGKKSFQLTSPPAVDHYDRLLFGAPVQAFSLMPVMAAYLDQLPSLQGKRVACFVTKQLPFNWTGGSRAVSAMKKICEGKGATVCGTDIIIWSGKAREQNISRSVGSLISLITDGV
jgi:flavodoxin